MTAGIRAARSADARRLGAILWDFVEGADWMPRRQSLAEDVGFCGRLIDRGLVTVAEADCRVAAFLAREDHLVRALYVAGGYRGRGLGKALLDEAKAACPDLDLWTFQRNTGAQRFYLREGFVEQDRTAGEGNSEGLPDIRYCWKRNAP